MTTQTTTPSSIEELSGEQLAALLERAAWAKLGTRAGQYARYAPPHADGDEPSLTTVIVPLATDAEDYPELLDQALETLRRLGNPLTGLTWLRELNELTAAGTGASDVAPDSGLAEIESTTGPLTVGQLREFLAAVPSDHIVVMSKDAEGNSYSPLTAAAQMLYVAESTWAGEVHPTPEAVATTPGLDGDDWSSDPRAVRSLVLWPTN